MSQPGAPYVIVPESRIPVVKEVDVLVCGGGPAGVCAAVAAALSAEGRGEPGALSIELLHQALARQGCTFLPATDL